MDLLQTIKEIVSLNIAVDMGTCDTRICTSGGGTVLHEPSCIAVSTITGEVVAAGAEAQKLIGRCPPEIEIAQPLAQGVVVDFDLAELMLQRFMRTVMRGRAMFGAHVVITVPAAATDVEIRAFGDIASHVGARQVEIVEAPVAAALGLSVVSGSHRGVCIIYLGGGTTQYAIFSGGRPLLTGCVRIGGEDVSDAISAGIKKKFGIHVGRHTVEQLKHSLGNAFPTDKDETRELYGKDIMNGLPRAVFVSNWEVREMMISPLEGISSAVKGALESIPPELSEDIRKSGIVLAGGSAQIRGMSKLIEKISGLKCSVSRNAPLACMAGAEKIAANPKLYERFLVSTHTRKLTE